MNFDFMHHGERRAENNYDGIKPELIDYAEKRLQKIIDGEVKSMNISREDAGKYMKELKNKTLSRSSVEALAYNHMDYLEGKER
ncbi:hypothetical protein K0A96_02035 [Patescibacteria group bacterium]|nr:hypothetical protein [Patescibacteria group bacterium]